MIPAPAIPETKAVPAGLEVVFAPDWRDGVPYQRLLADALAEAGVSVSFLQGYKRLLPLARLLRERAAGDVLHLHWPEAYYPAKGDRLDWFRSARFSCDLALATRDRALVVTAHNLLAHNRAGEPFAVQNPRTAFRRAQIVIAHSEAAKSQLVETHGLSPGRIRVIPHGDLSIPLGPPAPRDEARRQLGLAATARVCLMFGTIEPYKGIEDALARWRMHHPPGATLVIVGRPVTRDYGETIATAARAIESVDVRPGWLSDELLRLWLSAADCVLFNYRQIFTSGAACLARSYGVPLLLPARIATVDLAEPHPGVFRFDDASFAAQLRAALEAPTASRFALAQPWREQTTWPRIAALTAEAYREAIGK